MNRFSLSLLLLLHATLAASAQEIQITPATSLQPAGMPAILEVAITNDATDRELIFDLGQEYKGKVLFRRKGGEYPLRSELPTGGLIVEGSTTLRPGKTRKYVMVLDDWMDLDPGKNELEFLLKGQPSFGSAKVTLDVVKATPKNVQLFVNELWHRATSEVHVEWRLIYLAQLGKLVETESVAAPYLRKKIAQSPKLQAEIPRALKIQRSRIHAID